MKYLPLLYKYVTVTRRSFLEDISILQRFLCQTNELWILALSLCLSVGSANVTFLLTSSVHVCPRSLRATLHNSKDTRVLPLPTANFPDIIKASLLYLSLPLHAVTPLEVWCPRNVWNSAMISPKWFQSVTPHCLWVSWSDWCRQYGVSGELHLSFFVLTKDDINHGASQGCWTVPCICRDHCFHFKIKI